jgi:diguanylate cyclase (GGDEF)-like protein
MRVREGALGIVRRRVRPRLADELTGLGSRRQLRDDLRAATSARPGGDDTALILLTLAGFKEYDRANGHSAGDALLRELGARLLTVVPAGGAAYRTGGAEFCVLTPAGADGGYRAATAAVAALTEAGVSAWYGAARIPAETTDPGEALHIAGQRLEAGKAYPHPPAARSRVLELP